MADDASALVTHDANEVEEIVSLKRGGQASLANFDIDGTMLTAWAIHSKVYEATVHSIYGVRNFNFRVHYNPGDTVVEVIRSNLLHLDYLPEFIEKGVGRINETMEKYYKEYLPEGEIVVLPGVGRLLSRLKQRGIALNIVTGNRKVAAEMFLEKAGLTEYFDSVITSDHAPTRKEKLLLSIELSRKATGKEYQRQNVFYFDDSLHSIPVSKELRIKSVAVATGETTEDALREAGPNFIFKDLKNTDAVIRTIFSKKKITR